MRKIAALALAIAFALIPGIARATNDTNNPDWTTATKCQPVGQYSTVICAYERFHRQADDSGVTVDGANIWVANNACGDLNGYPEFTDIYWWGEHNNGGMKNTGNWADGDCNFSRNVNFNGDDTGPAGFLIYLHARIHQAPDRNVWFEWTLRTDGTSTITQETDTACPCPPA